MTELTPEEISALPLSPEAAARILDDADRTCVVEMSATEAMMVAANLHLALRHPRNIGPSAAVAEAFVRALHTALAELDPRLVQLLETPFGPLGDATVREAADGWEHA